MKQDRHQRAKERFADAMEAMSAQHERIREDLRFSNPANPQQWSDEARSKAHGRLQMTFDNTEQFIKQVENDGRASPPSIQCSPADGLANAKAAEVLNGRIRHIEYASRARVAYDTALASAARVGLGWLRAIPVTVNPEMNHQEPRIQRVHDPLSCVLDVSSTEPDGMDAEWGFVLSPLQRKVFAKEYPKSSASSWSDERGLWTQRDQIIVAEYFEVVTTKVNKLQVLMPDGETQPMTEEEYTETLHLLSLAGIAPPEVIGQFVAEERSVSWSKMTGCEELEETEFPSKYIPIVPVIGYELWVDGERYLCGMVRRMMDGQRMHNAEMSSYTESVLQQPKAPFAAPMRAIANHLEAWKKLNTGNPAFLVYDDIDEDKNAIAAPTRLQPPQIPTAFAQGAQMARGEMEASVGMYKSALGQSSNAVSGRAKQSDRRESDVANFHYGANLALSVEHLGRIIIDMDRRLIKSEDSPRTVRTLAENGTAGSVRYDPQMASAVKMRGSKVEAINPQIGEYDVRVKVGPSFLTQNAETAQELGDMFQGAPQLLPILGPLWIRLKGVPGAEKIAKLMESLAPPEVQAIYAEDENEEQQPVPPQVQAHVKALEQQVDQLSKALEAAAQEADKTRADREKTEGDLLIRGYEARTNRMKVTMPTPEEVAAVAHRTVIEALTAPPLEDDGDEPEPGGAMPPPRPPPITDQPLAEGGA